MGRRIVGNARTPLILASIFVAGIALAVHQTGRIYPWGLAAFFVGLVSLVVTVAAGAPLWSVVTSAIFQGAGYRLAVNYFTTPIGTSPQIQPGRMDNIVATGSAAESGTGFYGDAPIHFLVGAQSAMVFDTSAFDSILLYSVLIAIIAPLLAIIMTRAIGIRERKTLALVAILAVCTTEAIRRSYWVVPQTTGSIFWWLAMAVLVRYVNNGNKGLYIVIAVLTWVMAFTHKLPLFVLSLVFVVLLVLISTDRIVWQDFGWFSPFRQVTLLLVFVGTVTVIQLLYVGPLIHNLVTRITRIFSATETGAIRDPTIQDPSAATEVLPGMIAYFVEYPSVLTLFVERGHGIWLLLFAGVAWFYYYVFVSDDGHRDELRVLLGAAAVGAALLPIGVVAIGALNPTRVLVLIEPIAVVLVGALFWKIQQLDIRRIGRIAVYLIFVLLVLSQVFAASAAPDYANTPRYYADYPEAQAETTFCEFSTETVFVDDYYARYTSIDYESCSTYSVIGRSNDSPLFNAAISPDEHSTVAYRTNVDIYLGDGGDRWRLDWDPANELSSEYNTVYDNDGVRIMHSSDG